MIAGIHRRRGEQITVDLETASLLDFAEQCYRSSEGLFDITSGILRAVWHFDGSDHVPEASAVGPVPGAPRSVTVAASSCTEAGLVSTLALLHGARAGEFLSEQGLRYWVLE